MNDPLFRVHKLNEAGLANANVIANAFDLEIYRLIGLITTVTTNQVIAGGRR